MPHEIGSAWAGARGLVAALVALSLLGVVVTPASAQHGVVVPVAIAEALARGEAVELILNPARSDDQGVAGAPAGPGEIAAVRAELRRGLVDVVPVDHEFKYSSSVTATVTSLEELHQILDTRQVGSIEFGSQQAELFLDQARDITGATQSYAAGLSGQGVTVAVIDSGIERFHPDLRTSSSYEACFMINHEEGGGHCYNNQARAFGPGTAADDESIGHGTYVSGIIVSDGVVAPMGFAPDADLESYKIFGTARGGYMSDVVRVLEHIVDNRPDVDLINMSFGFADQYTGNCDGDFQPLEAAVDALRARGVVLVASSGNDSLKTMGAPACLSTVISVAAIGADERFESYLEITEFSNVSLATDLSAPGHLIQTTKFGFDTGHVRGTSFASAAVVGCGALVQESQGLTGSALKSRLERSSDTATNANGRSLPIVDCLAAARVDGDVDCSGDLNVVDALMIAQYSVQTRFDSGGCPIENRATQMHVAAADLTRDGKIDIVDALLASRCAVQIQNPLCP